MKRTEDGGAIIEYSEGVTEKISNREFHQIRIQRGLIRLAIIVLSAIIDILFLNSMGIFTIGMLLVMLGWWMKTGW